MEQSYVRGRGAQIHTPNPFSKYEYVEEHHEGIDEYPGEGDGPATELFYETPQSIISKYNSPDLGGEGYSLNPYQGCEHGCVYCYARNSHQYWGFNAGLDFESKIIVKKNAPALLEKVFLTKTWRPKPIMMSGNTDCYQPLEKKLEITRSLLKVFEKYRNPLSMITKNALIERDIDILQELAKKDLVKVFISINSMEESLRRKMEPRTASIEKRFKTIALLAEAGIPAGVMVAPVIPGLNDHDLPEIMKLAADHGATGSAYEVVRLNGSIGKIFKDWLAKNYPHKTIKVWTQIESLHGGKVNDTEWHRRLLGEGNFAIMIARMFQTSKEKYFAGRSMPVLNRTHFRKGGNLTLF